MRLLPWFLFSLALTSCATQLRRQDFDRILVGMDKDQVLEIAGNPKHSFRANGQDIWTYQFYDADKELFRQISFRDGRVTKLGAITSKRGLTQALENAETMEEYERAVKAHQQKSGGFEDVPEAK